jgi:hypothetical protein
MPPQPLPPPSEFFADRGARWFASELRPVDELNEAWGVTAGSAEAARVYGMRKAAGKFAGYARHVDAYLHHERISQRQIEADVGVAQSVISDFLAGREWTAVPNLLRLLEATEADLELRTSWRPPSRRR